MPSYRFVQEAHQQVCMYVFPLLVEHCIKVFLALVEVLALEHKGGQENVYVRLDRVALKLNNFLQELFCLWLLVVVEAEHRILVPLF